MLTAVNTVKGSPRRRHAAACPGCAHQPETLPSAGSRMATAAHSHACLRRGSIHPAHPHPGVCVRGAAPMNCLR